MHDDPRDAPVVKDRGQAKAAARDPSARRLVIPVAIVVVLVFATVAGITWYAAREQDRAALAQETAVVGANLREEFNRLAKLSRDFSWYDLAVESLIERLDLAFARDTIGRYLNQSHGVDVALVVDAENRDVFLAENGRQSAKPGVARVEGGLVDLIEEVRASSEIEPAPASGFVVIDGAFYLAAASAITPSYNYGRVPGSQRGVLVLGERLDPDAIERLGNAIGLSDVTLLPGGAARDGLGGVPIATVDGSRSATVAWTPASRGRALIEAVALPLGAVAIVILGLLGLFSRAVGATMTRLVENSRLLEAKSRDLEAGEKRLRAIVDHVADGIVVTDRAGTITSVNASAERLFGTTPETLVGRPFGALLVPEQEDASGGPDESARLLQTLADELAREPGTRQHVVGRRWGGGCFVLEAAVARADHRGESMFVAMLRDVTERQRAEETLNLLATGMVLVGDGGQILLCNRSAERLLAQGALLRREGDRLLAAAAWYDKDLQALIAKALASRGRFPEGSGAMNLHAAPGDKPLHVVVTPLRIADGARNLPVAAVIVRDTESQTEVRPELLQQLYGLTRAEARVVTELARGKRLTEVAQTLNVSVNTVRNQLKQAFAKTSTNRQADLVSLVLTSLSDLAQERERESVA
jgi:PAS domain S-box-containing protein